jgi:hypothetical protein
MQFRNYRKIGLLISTKLLNPVVSLYKHGDNQNP